ncbi:MAG TPA: SusC/RagA family TonB-linked outer membrane protein [Longimicrobiales bacterium]
MSKLRWMGALWVLLALPAASFAQQATLTGKVTSGSGQPLQSVSVFIQGLNVGTLTDREGAYSFQVPAARFTDGQSVQLIAQLIGYRAEAHTVQLRGGATAQQNFSLTLDPLRLTEIVATGSGTEARRERLGTSVTSVSGATVQRSNETNVVQALAGKVPNVLTNQASGDAGASTAIQIRGAKSFGTSQPLIVVDGVPINNATRNQAVLQGAVSPNRAADINPEDIESIEILKGAAASSIYGASGAAQGAILITTKRGHAGRTSYTLRSEYQADKAVKFLPFQSKYGVGSNGVSTACSALNCAINSGFFAYGPALAAGTPTFDHSKELYETGKIFDNTLSMSGGNERTTFYLSLGGLSHNGFIVGDNDYFKRYSVRFNGSHALYDGLTVSANASYVQTHGGGIDKGNSINGILLGGLRTPPEFDNRTYLDATTGLHRSFRFPLPGPTSYTNSRGYDNPFFSINESDLTAETGRIYGNVGANWKPLSWLQVNYTLGGDYTSDDRTYAYPQAASGTNGGSLERWQFYDRLLDSNLNATGQWQITPRIVGSLTVGQNLNETYFRQVDVFANTWIAPKPFKLSNTVTRSTPSDSESKRRTEGYFAQASTDIDDQLFLQARIRNDGSSAFGIGHQRAWYPGGSVAWSFTKAVSLPENLISFGKVRMAYGETGQQPGLYQTQDVFATGSFTDFNPGSSMTQTLNGIGGLSASTGRGNPDIAPERVKELEAGFDFSFFRGKADLGVTRYVSSSSGVIFSVGLPPSTGYTSISLNAGALSNKGWEVTSNIRPIQGGDFSFEVGINWAMNRNIVTGLGHLDAQTCTAATQADCAPGTLLVPTKENCGPEAKQPRCQIGIGSSFSGQTTHAQIGYPLGVWRAQDFARCGRGLTTIGANDIAAACQGAPDGALYIAADGFPIADPNARAIGNPWPDWTGGVSFTANYKGIEISAFVDHRQGGNVLNMTRGSMYNFGTHKDTELRGTSMTFGQDFLCHNIECNVLNGPVVGPGKGTAVTIGQGWFNGGPNGNGGGNQGGPISAHLEDATNTRLREISVGYSFKQAWVSKIAGSRQMDVKVSGRNLRLWTDYSGLDPETNLGGAQNANRGIDWFNNPLDRAVVVSVALHH